MSDVPSTPKLTTVVEMEQDFQELQKLRANVDDRNNAILDGRRADADAQFKAEQKIAIDAGILETPGTVDAAIRRYHDAGVRALAAKKTQDANGTWAYTKAAAAAQKPDKPYVAAARATEARAIAQNQPSQSMSMKPR